MGQLEEAVKIKIRRSKINLAILGVVAFAVVGGLNPQLLTRTLVKEFKTDKSKRRSAQNSIYIARNRLVRHGLLKWEDGSLQLTDEGRQWLKIAEADEYKLKTPKKWDKKWRILIFDVKEERKNLRDKIRRTLTSIGFTRLQDSVWVFPYDCEDLITLLKADFKVGKDLLYIIADEIENDLHLRKTFGLD